jgi:hypothetical protein
VLKSGGFALILGVSHFFWPDRGEPENDAECDDEPRDYPTPQSMEEQANTSWSDDISLEVNAAATPPQTSTEPEPSFEPARSETPSSRSETPSSEFSRGRSRDGRATVLSKRARETLQQTGSIYRVSRSSNFAIMPVFTSCYAGSTHPRH